jgi:hypothetical protein
MKSPSVISGLAVTGSRTMRSATRRPESAWRARRYWSSAPAAWRRNQPMKASQAPLKAPWKMRRPRPTAMKR